MSMLNSEYPAAYEDPQQGWSGSPDGASDVLRGVRKSARLAQPMTATLFAPAPGLIIGMLLPRR
jgi:hypothetical protein